MIIFSQDISFKGHLDGVGQSNSWGGQTGPWGGQLPPLTGPNGAYDSQSSVLSFEVKIQHC